MLYKNITIAYTLTRTVRLPIIYRRRVLINNNTLYYKMTYNIHLLYYMHVYVEHLSYSTIANIVFQTMEYRVTQYYTPMMFVNKGAHFNHCVRTQCKS